MLNGTVLFAHPDQNVAASIERILTSSNPGIHIERAASGADALTIQSVMRPEAVVMGTEFPDMSAEHLICEMKRDIVNPYLIVCVRKCSAHEKRMLLKMGANEVLQEPADVMKAVERIEERLQKRTQTEGVSLPEAALQRLFAEAGIPFDLKGYRYLKCALVMLCSGEAQLEPIRSLYERIGERFGCMPTAVERNIRYAVNLCSSRMESGDKLGNRQFIAHLIEQKWVGVERMCSPRVSVFCSGRRLFR